jgi:hypothetical protein
MMRGLVKVSVLTAAVVFAVCLFATGARGDDAATARGTVKGKVVRPDGTPAAAAELRLMKRPDKTARRANKDATKKGPADGAKPQAPARGANREVVASATADLNGEFNLADVPAGDYVLVARLKGAGNARQPVSVHAGNPAAVTLTLKAPGVQRKPGKQAARNRGNFQRREAKAARTLRQSDPKAPA